MPKSLWGKTKAVFADTEPASTLPMIPPGEESAYAETAPQPLVRLASAAAGGQQQGPLHELMAVVRKDNRVCPQQQRWQDFYQLLEDLNEGGAPLPPPPLVGPAWASTPALAKRMCFREQVEWAAAHNCMIAACTFLKALPETDWHYIT